MGNSASDPAEVLQVAREIQASGVIVAVGYMLRYSAAFEKAKELLSECVIESRLVIGVGFNWL